MQSKISPQEDNVTENSVESHYREWLSCYEQSLRVFQDTAIVNREMVAEAFRMEAIKSLNNILAKPLVWEEQLVGIRALLLLVKLYNEKWAKEDKENCFYDAVELANRISWGGACSTPEEEEIMMTYLIDMNPNFQGVLHSKGNSHLMKTIFETVILPKSRNRTLERELKELRLKEMQLKEMQQIRAYIDSAQTSGEILEKLIDRFKMIRLLIVSENSGEMLVKHWFEESEIMALKRDPINMRQVTVDVFDKPRKYMVMIDHGESVDRFEEYHLHNIINSMIDCFIKRREYELFRYTIGNGNEIEAFECSIVMSQKKNDYRALVEEVIEKCINPMSFSESREDKDGYIDVFLKALDICRFMVFYCKKDKEPQFTEFARATDYILWGKIERKVFSLVKSMLLSQNETMDGSGYPFGLSKKNIPLEWRIYMVIRAYEALSSSKDPSQVEMIMKKWAEEGSFDSEILHIFFDCLSKKMLPKLSSDIPLGIPEVSGYRFSRYASFFQSCSELLRVKRDIKNAYYDGRLAEGDTEIQNVLFKKANELRIKLLQIADIRKVIIITRHGETISDGPNWIPGGGDELLTEAGEKSSREQKWALFQGLHLKIFSSPLIRSRQTAAIICQEIRDCVRSIIPVKTESGYVMPSCEFCPSIIPEETITNPRKNQENDRYDDLLSKFIADSNTKWLGEFLKKLVSSGEETMNLFITHRDSGRHLIVWLKNIFSQDRISGEKVVIENDTVYEFVFQGIRLLNEGGNEEISGLIFSIKDWKAVVKELNAMIGDIFSETFYDPNNGQRVNLITLHDRFLDFIDLKGEHDPENLSVFMERIGMNPITKHIPILLEKNGVIG